MKKKTPYLDEYAADIKKIKDQSERFARLMRLVEDLEKELDAKFNHDAYEELINIAVFPRLREKDLALPDLRYSH